MARHQRALPAAIAGKPAPTKGRRGWRINGVNLQIPLTNLSILTKCGHNACPFLAGSATGSEK
jgi:hypothetical protein